MSCVHLAFSFAGLSAQITNLNVEVCHKNVLKDTQPFRVARQTHLVRFLTIIISTFVADSIFVVRNMYCSEIRLTTFTFHAYHLLQINRRAKVGYLRVLYLMMVNYGEMFVSETLLLHLHYIYYFHPIPRPKLIEYL